MYGHQGKLLRVDLSSGHIEEESYTADYAKMFLGGNGFAAKMIYDSVPADVEPFDPGNAVVFTVGPLTDTPVWGSSRGHMASISPLTGLFCDSNYGGQFAIAQKRAGYDAILVKGTSSEPVYIAVTDQGAEIRSAASLWGRSTEETIEALQSQAGEGAICGSIGPAGENRVLFANVVFGGKRTGVAGRGGLGAVMGAKHLKALVVKGSKRTAVADRESLTKVLKERYPFLKKNTAPFKTLGTPFLVHLINTLGLLGTRNNAGEVFAHARDLSGEFMKEKYWDRNTACYGCPVACGKMVHVRKGEYAGETVKMPEYETLYAFGSMMDNRDLDSIIEANHLCSLMGIDTISMGVTLAFVAECLDRGIIKEQDLGARVSFSDGEPFFTDLITKTASRQGIGKLLSMGSARLAKSFGEDSCKYLHAVKGLEVAGHSARGLRNMSLSYAVSTRGGSHHDGQPNYLAVDPDPGFEPQPPFIFRNNAFTAVGDSLVLCRFIAARGIGTPLNEDMVKLIHAVTGWSLNLEELEKIGERIYTLERLINVRRGVSRKDDTLPLRVMSEPIPDGPLKGRFCPPKDLDAMLDTYYELRGWTREGIPTDGKLKELGLV
jgi:aldehyde:ferredoxin oxidoreductase